MVPLVRHLHGGPFGMLASVRNAGGGVRVCGERPPGCGSSGRDRGVGNQW